MHSPFDHLFVLLLSSVLLSLGLLACSGGSTSEIVIQDEHGPTPTPEEARTAIGEAIAAFNRYCLAPKAQNQTDAYPVPIVNPDPAEPSFQYRQLRALVEAGLLDTTVTRSQGGLPVHRFSITAKGQQTQYEIAQARSYQPMFCYAVPKVAGIDSIKAQYNSGPNALAQVWFSYRYTNLGQWVRSPAVRQTYSGLQTLPDRRPRTAKMLLTRVDSAWVDRRLTGYPRPPENPNAPTN